MSAAASGPDGKHYELTMFVEGLPELVPKKKPPGRPADDITPVIRDYARRPERSLPGLLSYLETLAAQKHPIVVAVEAQIGAYGKAVRWRRQSDGCVLLMTYEHL